MSSNKLKYLSHTDIDIEKWNSCIGSAPNGRIYAFSWHLDRTAGVWDALVWGDYKYVMPLPVKKYAGIKILYQPLYSQQLGIFPNPLEEIAKQFFTEIVGRFRYSEVQLNSANSKVDIGSKVEFAARRNYLLGLNSNYNELAASFSKNTKRNIAKANKNGLYLIKGIRLEEYLEFKKKNTTGIDTKLLSTLKNVIAYGQYKNTGEIFGVYSAENILSAAVFFYRWRDRIIYLNAASSGEGKELRAMYFLVDNFLQSYAGTKITLDFEGSMIPGVERFYRGFGAEPETYFQLKFNNLPLPLKWLKRN